MSGQLGPSRERRNRWSFGLWALVLAAAIGCWPTVAARRDLEARSVHVELVADLEGVEQLARRTGEPVEAVLAAWRDAGVGSLALSPYRLSDVGRHGNDYLVLSGLELVRWQAMAGRPPDLGDLPLFSHYTYVIFPPHFLEAPFPARAVLEDVRKRRWGDGPTLPSRSVWESVRGDGSLVLALPVPDPARVHEAFLGLSPVGLELVSSLGLRPVPRWSNAAGRGGEAVEELVAALRDPRPSLVIFSGGEALGYPHHLGEVARSLGREGMAVGWVEFAYQKGLPHLINLLDGRAVRVHSITDREMDRLSPERAVRRWVRAVRERGIRVLYVRPFLRGAPPEELLAYNEAYLHRLVDGLREAGMAVGPARPLGDWRGSAAQFALAAGGVGAALALTLRFVGHPGPLLLILATFGPPLLAAGLYLKGYTVLSRQALAFAATLVFPVLAVGSGMQVAARSREEGPSGGGRLSAEGRPLGETPPIRPGAVARGLGVAAGVTAVGAVLLVALLADYRFMLGTEQYLGVKAAHVVPVAAMAAVALRWSRGGPGAWRAVSREPIRWGHVLALALLGAALAVYVLRTGHHVLGVGEWEIRLREWLEAVLPVRPRTKEVAVGYPALLLALAGAAGRGRTPGRWLLPALATVAPISVLNSFAHVHTPLAVSALRSLLGLAVGGAMGWVAVLVLGRLARLVRGSHLPTNIEVGSVRR